MNTTIWKRETRERVVTPKNFQYLTYHWNIEITTNNGYLTDHGPIILIKVKQLHMLYTSQDKILIYMVTAWPPRKFHVTRTVKISNGFLKCQAISSPGFINLVNWASTSMVIRIVGAVRRSRRRDRPSEGLQHPHLSLHRPRRRERLQAWNHH